MPVVINEFEIVTDQTPPAPATRGASAPQQSAPQPLRPQDVAQIHRYHLERMKRLRAD